VVEGAGVAVAVWGGGTVDGTATVVGVVVDGDGFAAPSDTGGSGDPGTG